MVKHVVKPLISNVLWKSVPPELSGFSRGSAIFKKEVELAIAKGFGPVGLGRSRLRTETAGVVACHTAVLLNEE